MVIGQTVLRLLTYCHLEKQTRPSRKEVCGVFFFFPPPEYSADVGRRDGGGGQWGLLLMVGGREEEGSCSAQKAD